MPFGFGVGDSSGGYGDIEQAPLSALDNDDENDSMPLPPYSDTPSSLNGADGSSPTNNILKGDTTKQRNTAHKAISIQDEDTFLSRNDNNVNSRYDEDYDEYEGYHASNNNNFSSATPSKNRRPGGSNTRYYRGGLIYAYIKDIFSGNVQLCYGGASKFMRILFYMFLVVIIVGCAAGIGYIVAQDGSPFVPDDLGKEENVGGSDKNDIIVSGNLPPPPENLHEICSDWITASGRLKCQTECNVAKCCSLAATDKNSCWEDQASNCATYRSACMALELNSGVASDGIEGIIKLKSPNPTYIDEICSIKSLQTPDGFDLCSEECRPSRCCHPETYGCEVDESTERFCSLYEEPCSGVVESWRGSGHAVATTASDGTASKGGATTQTKPNSANEVILRCNADNLNPPDECIEACHPGACCYVSNSYPPIEQLFDKYYGGSESPMKSVTSCSSNTGFCQQFGSCEHLNNLKDTSGWNSNTVEYELDIANVCKPEYIAQFGALECSNVCQPAHCCFSGEYKCDDVQLGNLNCETYNDCGVLYPGYKSTAELFQMAKHIDEVCSEDMLVDASSRNECQNLCKDRLCCFDDVASCANDNSKHCIAYAGCETLTLPETNTGNQPKVITPPSDATTKKNVDEEVDEFITALESACSVKSLTTLEGIQQCHNKCQTHLCCFDNDVTLLGNNCSNVHPDACNAYKPCERLVTPTTQNPLIDSSSKTPTKIDRDVAKATVDAACMIPENPSQIDYDWISKCHGVCASRLCCFVDKNIGSNCQATQECDVYASCKVLLNDSGNELSIEEIEDEYSNIEDICDSSVAQDSSRYETCDERCSRRSCCFEDKPEYSCYIMEQTWCEEYESCSFVELTFPSDDDDDVLTFVDNTQSFKTLCTSSTISQNRQTCKNHCSRYECCFRSEDSCYDKNKLECDEYYICEEFYSGTDDTGVVATIDNIEAVCDHHKLAAPCKEKCKERSCCFEDEPEYSCYSTEKGWCDEFERCSLVGLNFLGSASTKTNEANIPGPSSTNVQTNQPSFKSLCGTKSALDQNRDKCKDHCSQYECCFRKEDSCYEKNKLECDEYFTCEDFFMDVSSSVVSTSNVNPEPHFTEFQAAIEAACSSDSLKTLDGIEQCFNKCQAHLCCVPTDAQEADFDCSDKYPDECNSYYVCEQLVDQYNLWSPPSTSFDPFAVKIAVEDACNLPDDLTRATEEQITECLQVCEARMCCLAHESLDSNCAVTLGKDECDAYAACQVLVGGEERKSDNIEAVCDHHKLAAPCKEKCKERSCCFEDEPEYSCYSMEKDWCDEFERCSFVGLNFLGNVSTKTNEANIPGPTSDTSNEVEFDEINIKCEEDYLLSQGMEECEYYCEAVKCCFDSQCSASDESVCTRASLCDNYFNPGSEELQIEKICSEEVLDNNEESCQEACKPYECCFNNYACSSSIDAECTEYEPCRLYFETYQSDADKQSSSNPGTSSGGLANINSESSSPNSDTVELEVFKIICSESDIEQNKNICKDKCIPYECCFNTDNSCSKQKDCKSYEICEGFFVRFDEDGNEVFAGSDDIGPSVSSPSPPPSSPAVNYSPFDDEEILVLTKACSLRQIRTDETQCKMLCRGSECCFSKTSPCTDKEQFCNDHTSCASMFT